MTILGGEFAVLLLLTGEGDDCERRLSSACRRLEWEKRLTVFIRPLEGEPVPYEVGRGATAYELNATGVDKAGLVARLTRCLAERGASITRMLTRSRPGADSGTPIYEMRIRIAVPEGVEEESLRAGLERVASELHIEVSLEPAP